MAIVSQHMPQEAREVIRSTAEINTT